MNDYNNGAWWGWNGGGCPVHRLSRVQWTRHLATGSYGEAHQGESDASGVKWDKISAFRVTKEHREPREWWLFRDRGGVLKLSAVEPSDAWFEIIHVQEKME